MLLECTQGHIYYKLHTDIQTRIHVNVNVALTSDVVALVVFEYKF